MRLHCSRAVVTLLRLMAPVVVMAFMLLPLLATPGAAYAYVDVGIDIEEEVMQEVIDPCFLAVVRKNKRTNPDLYADMDDNDLLNMMKALSPEDSLAMASDFAASLDLQSMTRKERFKVYALGRDMCVSKASVD
ncbi:hypothetical protein FLM9_1513 [Candidatus Synechococcus spongiarum]|uniref:Uncharacterized protein n=2 Tax=Candidatus Synechococcus spongiarum TaxID=431041 RepID=A0A161KBL4_9SYNE|nr:hypothetical protein FLM9_1513 [Candidatus Synechococcus spongiarum]